MEVAWTSVTPLPNVTLVTNGQGRRKLVEVRGAGSKIYIQDGYFLVNVYIDFIVDNTKTTYGRLHLW